MSTQTCTAFALALGLVLTLASASCGPTCPPGQQNCGTSNPGNAAGSDDGAGNGSTCDFLTAVQSCMNSYCATATNPFCTCYKRGYDITTNGCTCVTFDTKKFCDQAEANGADATAYDCAAASSSVSSICVGVMSP